MTHVAFRSRMQFLNPHISLVALQFLAMGSDLKLVSVDEEAPPCDDTGVKEALKKLGLPATPQGAKTALVMLNRWTSKQEEVR